MFKFTKKDKRTKLEKEIDGVITIMSLERPSSPEYKAMAANLVELYKAKAQERNRRVSPDTIAIIAGNLAGLVLIMNYERLNIITTKALGFVIKGRV
jgi:Uma2 family endonuclease